jgi:hypothetical protein
VLSGQKVVTEDHLSKAIAELTHTEMQAQA